MKFECKNCGEIFYADVKTQEDLARVRCEVCASFLVRELGPGLGLHEKGIALREPPELRKAPEEQLLAIVKSLAQKDKEGASYDAIMREFVARVGSRERAKELFEALRLGGRIMEVARGSGKYKVVGIEEFAL